MGSLDAEMLAGFDKAVERFVCLDGHPNNKAVEESRAWWSG